MYDDYLHTKHFNFSWSKYEYWNTYKPWKQSQRYNVSCSPFQSFFLIEYIHVPYLHKLNIDLTIRKFSPEGELIECINTTLIPPQTPLKYFCWSVSHFGFYVQEYQLLFQSLMPQLSSNFAHIRVLSLTGK